MSGVNGVNGINAGGANFNNGVNAVVSKPVNNTSPQKPAENPDKKMSTGMKVGLGAAAVAVSVIAGLAIKNKAAEKAVAKAAKEMGVDVKSYVAMKSISAGPVSKIENITYEDMYNRLKSVYKLGIAKEGDSMILTPGFNSKLKELNKNIPDNSVLFTISRGEGKNEEVIHSEVFLYDNMANSLKDMIGSGKSYVQKLTNSSSL